MPRTSYPFSRFTEDDIQKFASGNHFDLFTLFGNHPMEHDGFQGIHFAVWAPNAKAVSVGGNFNGWNQSSHPLFPRWDSSGIWEGFIPHLQQGELYKYFISTRDGKILEKGDPYANYWEKRPKTASITWNLGYEWKDQDWMFNRKNVNSLDKPISVYELHLGSWRRNPISPDDFLSYREIGDHLIPYVKELGFTHVEFMPILEHPFDGSWGYQPIGYYAPTSRFGNPQEFMELVDRLHQAGIGVYLDWVPSHFPLDAHGLFQYDGTCLYEHEDHRKGYHPDWNCYIFNLGRNEVKSFMLSNAVYWMEKYHIDGLRVDAVASMLYLDYSRKQGEWIPNIHGGRENLESIDFFKTLNETLYSRFEGIQTIAEESTSWPGVSRPTSHGGLGFGMKWMMGWMNDSLSYFQRDPYYRQFHQNEITQSLTYAFSENFMLPLSHDEVVHGKKAIVSKMPGDEWQRFANTRLLYLWMFSHPGTKLLFMGNEFGQTSEWNYHLSLDWHLLQYPFHSGLSKFIAELNKLYTSNPALYDLAFSNQGFEWIDFNDHGNSVISYTRKGKQADQNLVVILNLTPIPRNNYRIGLPDSQKRTIILNTDSGEFGGSDYNLAQPKVEEIAMHGRRYSVELTLPPLGGLVLVPDKA
ncbi:MAG: 1,4-alpha-glucan branching protein GlgB [Bacteroidia bacterium]|nr:1,4-alpha-glucan branching protein GlgB [Bacteroidia bacterium]